MNEWVSSLMQSTTKITTVVGPEGGHPTINQNALRGYLKWFGVKTNSKITRNKTVDKIRL